MCHTRHVGLDGVHDLDDIRPMIDEYNALEDEHRRCKDHEATVRKEIEIIEGIWGEHSIQALQESSAEEISREEFKKFMEIIAPCGACDPLPEMEEEKVALENLMNVIDDQGCKCVESHQEAHERVSNNYPIDFILKSQNAMANLRLEECDDKHERWSKLRTTCNELQSAAEGEPDALMREDHMKMIHTWNEYLTELECACYEKGVQFDEKCDDLEKKTKQQKRFLEMKIAKYDKEHLDALTEEGHARRALEDAVKVLIEKMQAYKKAKQISSQKCQKSEIAKACGEKMTDHHTRVGEYVGNAKRCISTKQVTLVEAHQKRFKQCEDIQQAVSQKIAETSNMIYGNEEKVMQVAEVTGWSISARKKALEKEISQLDHELNRVRNARGKEGYAENVQRVQEIKNKKSGCVREKELLEALLDEWEARGFNACNKKEEIAQKGLVNRQAEDEAARKWVADHVPPEADSVTDLAPALPKEGDPSAMMAKMMQIIQELQAKVEVLQNPSASTEVKLPVPGDLAN